MRNKYISKFKLHSIPILHKSKCLRYVSYSIPLISAAALLLLLGNLFIINPSDKTYADEGIEAYAATPDPTVSLTINGGTSVVSLSSNATAGGDTAYTTPATVAYSANDVSTYALQISYAKGSTGLARENTTNTTTIGGAGGKIGSELGNNTWGYAWVPEATTDYSASTYYTIPTYGTSGTSLATGQLESGNNAGSGTNKLIFAAKFGSDAIAGHYKASVLLSLAVTPKELTLGFGGENNRITTMQEMTPEVCASAEIGEAGSGILKDTRDNNIYNVTRLDDGNCWMTSNLALTKEGIAKAGNSPKLTSADSNVTDDSTSIMPDSIETLSSTTSPKDFSGQIDYNNVAQIYDGGSKDPKWKPSYGSYYNWYAATAGTGNAELITAGEEAGGSICPRGWVLPSNGDFSNLMKVLGISSADTTAQQYLKLNDYFSRAGWIFARSDVEGLGSVNSSGNYWSGTSMDSVNAYVFYLSNYQGVYTQDVARSRGYTVRCITPSAEPEPEKTWETMETMQEMTPEICKEATIGDTRTLTDTRDGSTYMVGKLSDGNCWMTQNLRITRETINAKDSTNTTGKITSANSNVNADYEIPASTKGAFSDAKTGDYYTNQQVRASVDNDYGAYYSYNVVTVNTVATASSGSAKYDICPKGWRLPTGGSNGEFQALYNKGKSNWTTNGGKGGYWIGAADATGGAFFPAARDVNTSGLSSTGSYGYYWSSTISNADDAYDLLLSSSYIDPANNYSRYYGFSVRCVAR